MLLRRLINPATSTVLRESERSRNMVSRLRPGGVLALAVVSVVGAFGIIQWNQRLIITGFAAGLVIIAINIVVVTTQYWHRRNTTLEASYLGADEVVRHRTPKPR
ncbi:MAG: hypothetical protein R8J94_23440 [Acidimicrobiia bacterium]|nr:hypothetical protein [Acidimicrobiia bacterium]